MAETKANRIRTLNDAMRRFQTSGTIILTAGVQALGPIRQDAILAAVATFDRFDRDNDPYGEHDFGAVEVAGERVFWKIDYYDRALACASPDPANSALTQRVLTIMLSEEY